MKNTAERLIKLIKHNKASGKTVIIPYSGGKDSHLALIKLIENGFFPIIFYASLGEKNLKYFNSPDVFRFIKNTLPKEIPWIVTKSETFVKKNNERRKEGLYKINKVS